MPTRAHSNTNPSKPHRVRATARGALALLFALCAAASVFAQGAQREVPATVAGRVTDGERGVAGVVVMLTSGDQPVRSRVAARAKTDAEGRYRVTNVPPGRYQVMPFAPAYVVEGLTNGYPPGRPLMLAAGDVAEDIDFRVERGGVVTGRVTDAEGNAVIGMSVSLLSADNNNQRPRIYNFDPRDNMTDDRGIYRIYGLPAGRYRVSAGQGGEGSGAISFGRRKLYRRTFYPDTTDEAQAEVIELKAGSEATDIDIKLGNAVKTYKASGVFVVAETGMRAPNILFGYGALDPSGQRVSSFGGGTATNARGEFQTEALAPGRYSVFAYPFGSPQNNNDFYSDPVTFEVTDADVTGLVVKLKRGATLSGVVAVEGASDRATAARVVGQMIVYAGYETRGPATAPGNINPAKVAPDGSFRITGLRPGKLHISASGETTGGIVTISRVELNGANVTNGIDVAEGAQVAGVRVVVVYGSAVIRGQLNVLNGTVAPGVRLTAFARRVSGGEGEGWRSGEVDMRGRFVMHGLTPGEYDVHVQGFVPGTPQRYQSEHQSVSVAENGEASVTLSLDLNAPQNKGGRP